MRLWWKAPRFFRDQTVIPADVRLGFRIYRDGILVGQLEPTDLALREEGDENAPRKAPWVTTFEDEVPKLNRMYRYSSAAVFLNGAGVEVESIESDPLNVTVSRPLPPTEAGEFEPSAVVAEEARAVALPQSAISEHEELVFAHVAYVVRAHGGKGDAVRYIRSERSGRPGSFELAQTLLSLLGSKSIGDLALSAQGQHVSIAWIEHDHDGSGRSQLWVCQSNDAGLRFAAPVPVGGDNKKRYVSLQFDAFGNLHTVWSEGVKVFYLKNLEGTPSNVFDVKKREVADEIVKYKVQYPPREDGACDCADCWCEESYVVDGYRYRIEEAHMVEPSLHVDDNAVSIIARQVRLFDNQPVEHPAWRRMFENPVYRLDPLQEEYPIRHVVGWQETWKRGYEQGDQALWDGLGAAYQFQYAGTWHEEDRIVVAQRPIVEGGWASLEKAGWQVGGWLNDVEQAWRISVVDPHFEPSVTDRPSHPVLYTADNGKMVAVYEKGSSLDPNAENQNPIFAAYSDDGGLHWTGSTKAVLRGYVPQVAAIADDVWTILSYAPNDSGSAGLTVSQKAESADWSFSQLRTEGPLRTVHHQTHGQGADTLEGVPSLSAYERLFFAVWAEDPKVGEAKSRVVSARATNLFRHGHHRVQATKASTGGTSVSVVAENRYSMRVNAGAPAQVAGRAASQALEPVVNARTFAEPEFLSASAFLEAGANLFVSESVRASWFHGGLASVELHGDGASLVALAGFEPEAPDTERVGAVWGSVHDNHARAVKLRQRLLRQGSEGQAETYYQVEYEPLGGQGIDRVPVEEHPNGKQGGAAQDSKYLAQFERVWAYTQGIALAQFSHEARGGPRHETTKKYAQGLARYLCSRAEWENGGASILGWPFSWNTLEAWQDRRLVTGANAWVAHGLGVFVASMAFQELSSVADQEAIRRCYLAALRGLHTHRQTVRAPDGRRVSLMTAGWSSAGLEHVQDPTHLKTEAGHPITLDEHERWSYYSLLDGIGYDTFSPFELNVCVLGSECDAIPRSDSAWTPRTLESEEVWAALKARVRATNVVTEHNLDVLSVLNHALDHADGLQLPADGIISASALEAWRDELRDGIFYGLWDDEDWKTEFEWALDAMVESGTAQPSSNDVHTRARRQAMEVALASPQFGRVVTGGTLEPTGSGDYVFQKSLHSAIDNCSWLSLSVDYKDLDELPEDLRSPYVERLAQCLQYTVIQYVKELGFGESGCHPERASCPRQEIYLGAHYFQNTFKDPYIAPSDLQASSYHLEATMGLILGLLRFYEAYPDHPQANAFLMESRRLWAGAQAFVEDHGFPYSSQRIQDLSTQLSSSTAAIWFVDVYAAFSAHDGDFNRPLKHYAVGQDLTPLRTLLFGSAETEKDDRGGAFEWSPHPLARIEGDALRLLLAVAQENQENAERHVRALLDSVGANTQSNESRSFFTERVSSNQVAVQMLAYYAWSQYLHRFSDSTPGLSDEVRVNLCFGLETLARDHVEGNQGDLIDLFRRPELLPNLERSATLGDNILAFFALDGARAVFTDPVWVEGIESRVNRLRGALENLCGALATLPPWSVVFETSSPVESTDHDDYALCSLFFAQMGAYDAATDILEATAYFTSPAGDSGLEGSAPGAPSLFSSGALGVLARRALAAQDPRQDQLALLALSVAARRSLDANGVTALELASHPGGVLGVQRGGFAAVRFIDRAPNKAVLPERLVLAKRRLADRYLDAALALLASEPRDYVFDTLFLELVTIQRAHDALFDGPAARFSRQDAIRMVAHQLRAGLCREESLIHAGSVTLVDQLGVACEPLGAVLDELFVARGMVEPGTAGLFLEIPELGPTVESLMDEVLREDGGASGLWSNPPIQGAVPSSSVDALSSRSLVALRSHIRGRLETRAKQMLSSVSQGQSIGDTLAALDPLDAFHAESPHYYKRLAVELRAVLASDAAIGPVEFRIGSHVVPLSGFLLEEEAVTRLRDLRRELNQTSDGAILTWARTHDVPQERVLLWSTAMHRFLRTGGMPNVSLSTMTDIWKMLFSGDTPAREDLEAITDLAHLVPDASEEGSPNLALGPPRFLGRTPEPSLENIDLALREMVESILSGNLSAAGAPENLVFEFGGRLALVPSKLALKAGPQASKWLDEVARLPSPWALGALSGLSTAAYLSSAQVDVGIETILVSGAPPSSALWERVGVVDSERIVSQPTGTHLQDESSLRAHVSIFPEGPVLDDPLSNPPLAFHEDDIYLIQIDWLGVELPYGHFGVLMPGSGKLWPVFKLRSERPRAQILEDFVRAHKFWQHFAAYAKTLPLGDQDAFLFLLELIVRGEFNRGAAESFGTGRAVRVEAPSGDNPGIVAHRHAPFFVPDGEGGQGVFGVAGGRDGLASAQIVEVPTVPHTETSHASGSQVPLSTKDRNTIKRILQADQGAYPFATSDYERVIMLRLYQNEDLRRRDLVPAGGALNSVTNALARLVKKDAISVRTHYYNMGPAKLHDALIQDLRFFWGDANGLEDALGPPAQSEVELKVLRNRLEGPWGPVARTLNNPTSRAIVFVLHRYGPLSQAEIWRVPGFHKNDDLLYGLVPLAGSPIRVSGIKSGRA